MMQVVATACLFLAGKVEDTPRSLHRISETMYEAYCINVVCIPQEKAEERWKDTVHSFSRLPERLQALLDLKNFTAKCS